MRAVVFCAQKPIVSTDERDWRSSGCERFIYSFSRAFMPPEWWAVSLAVGVVIAVMAMLRVTHPPAGADPVVIFLSDPGWSFLFVPILPGCLVLVGIATLVHMIPPRTIYPLVLEGVLRDDDNDLAQDQGQQDDRKV